MGGNYAASLRANKKAHDLGYSCEFYLDAKEKKYIDECGAANFFGIKNNTYITPKSSSILPSITNKSLMQLAEDLGIKVECRPVPEEELETFEEAGATWLIVSMWRGRNRRRKRFLSEQIYPYFVPFERIIYPYFVPSLNIIVIFVIV